MAEKDTLPHPFRYQVKLGRSMPSYLWDWLQGICATAERHGRIGVVVWKPKNKRDADAVVMVKFKDWAALHSSQEVDVELHKSVVGGETVVAGDKETDD